MTISTLSSRPSGAAGRGSRSAAEVRQLQRHLEARGYSVGPHGADGKYGPATRRAHDAFLRAAGQAPAPATRRPAPPQAADTLVRSGRMQGLGRTKDGLTIPAGQGRATTFWNGHIAYKGKYDMHNRQNGGLGAWGDKCRPTDYFVALPVSNRKWHNQKILVTDPASGRQVVALVQDKGPHGSTGAKIDLSPVTMEALGGHFNGSMSRVVFEFAPTDAPLGPVRR